MLRRSPVLVVVLLITPVMMLAQYTGGSGKGDASAFSLSPDVPFAGGSGRGEVQNAVTGTRPATLWDVMQNNRGVSWEMFGIVTANGTVTVGTGTPPTTKRLMTKAELTTYQVSVGQPGMMQGSVPKTSNQVLIRGDYRSIRIDVSAGQTQCNGTNFTQTLWLDIDGYIAGETQCYTDKTLETVYTGGDGTSWYCIQSGGAIKIDSNGYVVEVSTCP